MAETLNSRHFELFATMPPEAQITTIAWLKQNRAPEAIATVVRATRCSIAQAAALVHLIDGMNYSPN